MMLSAPSRAELAIVEAAPKLETAAGTPLHVRVGIATGIVVVGDCWVLERRRSVRSSATRRTSRRGFRDIAEPDSVAIAEGTRKLLGNLFELVDLGPQDLKGVAGPTRAYAALRESAQESRSRRCTRAGWPRSSGGKKRANSCCDAGQGRRRARARSRSSRRGGRRRVKARGVPGTAGGRAAYPHAVLLFAAAHGQRAPSDHRPHGAGGRARARR